MSSESKAIDDAAISNFREYLRIPSVHPNVDYSGCVEFLRKQANGLGLPIQVFYPVPNNPVVIITWEGTSPSLPSILLNSHMDVVPVFPDSWIHPPFDAHMTEDGKIYARGSQDMKCVAIQYIETVRRLKQNNIRLRRTLHLNFTPDEELGGVKGMKKFIETDDFKNLNVGFSLDEGIASPNNDFLVYYGERSIWQLIISCPGNTGHGSLLLDNTAGEKIRIIMDRFMDYRAKEKKKLEDNPELTVGEVTTINLTMLYGGIQRNVIPEKLSALFDIRLAVDVDHDEFEKMIRDWCKEAGDDTIIVFEQKGPKVKATKIDETNPFWVAFKKTEDDMKLSMKCRIFPGGTDSRYVRGKDIPAIGFSPMINTPVLLHDHNEYLKADVFLKGIEIYEKLITSVANVE